MNASTDRLDDLMDRYLYGLSDEALAARVRRQIESDPEWKLAYDAAVARKRALADGLAAGSTEAAATRAPAADDVIAVANRRAKRIRRTQRIVRGSFAGLAAAAAVVIALGWVAVWSVGPGHAVQIIGQTDLASGSTASIQAIVTDLDGRPAADVPVAFVMHDAHTGREIDLGEWTSDADGRAGGQIALPDWDAGDYTLVARTDEWNARQLAAPIKLKRSVRAFLSTDKPVYQPGQTVLMRCLVLRKPQLAPDAGRPVEFSVTDPVGNIVFSQSETLSEYGIASAELPTDPLISPGRYTVKLAAGADTSEQTIEIFHYKLPAFAVKVDLDQPYYRPGQTVTGKVDVQYHFGKPVAAGEVELTLTGRGLSIPHELEKLTFKTDDDGKAEFRVILPGFLLGSRRTQGDGHLLMSVRATDPAGQENTAFRNVVVAAQDIRVAAVAEGGLTADGATNRVFIVTSYPDGRPAETTVAVEGLTGTFKTDKAGVAVIEGHRVPDPIRITARDEAGKTGRADIPLPVAAGDAFVLRTDKPIYTAGQTVSVEVISSGAGDVYVDLVKDRQTLLTKTLTLANGRGTLALDIPGELSGILHLHAYRLDAESEWNGRDALIVVRPAGQLTVAIAADKNEYRPGKEAKLVFKVTGAGGAGVPAALSLAGVDAAVFSIQQAAPGLEGVLTGLDEEILTPAVEVHGFSPSLMGESDDYARAVLAAAAPIARGNAAAAPRAGSDETIHTLKSNNADVVRSEYFDEKEDAEERALKSSLFGGGAIVVTLLLLGIFWGVGTPRELGGGFGRRGGLCLGLLIALVIGVPVVVVVSMPAYAGRAESLMPLRIAAAGPEDVTGEFGWTGYDDRVGVPAATPAPAAAEMPPSLVTVLDIETASRVGPAEAAEPVRTRSYFPETLLWKPQLIADETGRAELTVALADSITTWRIAGTAVGRTGRLGTVDSSVRVFQPFFADVDAPLHLTVGDEASVPVVLYNYTREGLEVNLRAEAADGLTVLEGVKLSELVTPGQVKRVYVRVKADTAGTGALTVHAAGGKIADAVRREIRIVPPGLPQSLAVNGTIADGEQFVEFTVPAGAVDDSVTVDLKIYPSTFSTLIDGLENILRMPSGCFEQTSSTTWPNVMALNYMKANGMDKPEIAAKATRYIQLGYQRLLSFEVKGGGFDWFGNPPANTVLTAYGLMEFADMAKVYPVDRKVLDRTAEWLASKQTSDGSWQFTPGIFHEPFTGGDNSPLAITAYVTWAIADLNPDHPAARRGADYVANHVSEAKGPYAQALVANALLTVHRGDSAAGLDALAALEKSVQTTPEGLKHWGDVSSTSLAVLAMARSGRNAPLMHKAMQWLIQARDPYGTWGSTTPTVLALRALLGGTGAAAKREAEAGIAYALASGPDKTPPVDGLIVIPPDKSDLVRSIRLTGITRPGTYRLRVEASKAAGMAWQVAVRYNAMVDSAPVGRDAGPLAVKVDYDRTDLAVGGAVNVTATVTNNTGSVANMLVVDVGTPPGFAAAADGLEKLKDAGKVSRYTMTARGVIFYVDKLAAGASLELGYRITARMPVRAVAAPTLVYSYYKPDEMAAAKPATFTVR